MPNIWRTDYRVFLSSRLARVECIISDGILPRESRVIIGGDEKIGKTILVTQMALDIASGMPFLGLFDIPSAKKVVLIQAEVPQREYRRRLGKSVKRYSRKISSGYLTIIGAPVLDIESATGHNLLRNIIAETNAEVIIFDPMYKFHSRDEDRAGEMKHVLAVLDSLIAEYDISVVMTHHLRKPFMSTSGRVVRMGTKEISGTSLLTRWADSLLVATPNPPKVVLDMVLRHAEEDIPRVILTLNRNNVLFDAEIPGGPTAAEAVILALVAGGTTRYIDVMRTGAQQLNVTPGHVKKIIASCRTKGLLSTGPLQLLLPGPTGTTWETEEDEIAAPIDDDL